MATVMQASALQRRPVSCGLVGTQQQRPPALTPAQARTSSGSRLGGSPPSTTTGVSRAGGQPGLDYSPAARGLQGFPHGQLAGGYPGAKGAHSPAVHNAGKSVHSPASTATTTTPGSSLSGRNSTPTRQDPLSSGRGSVPQRFPYPGQRTSPEDKSADQRMGQAPVPNHLKFDPPAATGSRSGLDSTELSDSRSAAAPSLHRGNGGAEQLSGRDNRPNGVEAARQPDNRPTGIEWSSRERVGGTSARPLRGPRSPVREPAIHGRGQQLQPPGVPPPKVQQPSGQTQTGQPLQARPSTNPTGQQLQPQEMPPPKVQQPSGQTQAGQQANSSSRSTAPAANPTGQQLQPQGMPPPKVQQPSGQAQAGQQPRPQGMSPPKVQQTSGQIQKGNSVTAKFEDVIISAQMQCSRSAPLPAARGNCQDAPFAPRALLQGRDLNDPNQSAQNAGKEEFMMDKLQDANKKWFCEDGHSQELLGACANFMQLTLMPDTRTREHSLNAVRSFVEQTMKRCQYHNVHLVLALIYLQRYHESTSFKVDPDIKSDHLQDPWKALQKDFHVALHLAECWFPMDNDAPLKGTHVVRQSGLLGEVGEEKFPQVTEKKKGLYWEQWVICKALEWKFYVTREEFVQFGEKVHKDKATKEAQNMISRSNRGGLQRGGMQINARGAARSMPATLNRGINSRSEPSVPGPRTEMLSPKGRDGDDARPSDKASDEDKDQAGESAGPQYGVAPGRPMNNLGPCQAPRPCQPGQSKLPSRATVGGAPLASDMRRPAVRPAVGASEDAGNSNAGGRPGQAYGIRGREPGENGSRSNVGSRMPQPAPFAGAAPPPVSSRGAGPRTESALPNSSRPTGTGGPLSALDSSRGGAQLRVSTDPGSRSGPQPAAAQGLGASAGGQRGTPPTNNHTPRPHAFTGSLGASRPGAAAPQTGLSPYGAYASSPARGAGITVNRGVAIRR